MNTIKQILEVYNQMTPGVQLTTKVFFGSIAIYTLYKSLCLILRIFALSNLKKRYNIIGRIPLSSMRYRPGFLNKYKFDLYMPYWLHSNKNYSPDKRKKDNQIIYNWCYLSLGKSRFKSRYPELILSIVRQLRNNGVEIDLSYHCEKKKDRNKAIYQVKHNAKSVQDIIDAYASKPTMFEEFCASYFRDKGFNVTVTPPTTDGGYDLILIDPDTNTKIIAECKCYAISNKIGRPMIQKLVGANGLIEADYALFITTSDYTKQAREYAEEMNVRLIDMNDISKWLKDYVNYNKLDNLNLNDYTLTFEELQDLYPPNIFIKEKLILK